MIARCWVLEINPLAGFWDGPQGPPLIVRVFHARGLGTQNPLQSLADQALTGDVSLGGLGLEGGEEGFGQAHVQAG